MSSRKLRASYGCRFAVATVGVIFGGGTIAVAALPILPTAIFASSGSSAASTVPGTASSRFTSFSRATFSADGTQWIFSAATDIPLTQINGQSVSVIVRGSGFTSAGSQVVHRRGADASQFGASVFYNLISDPVTINDSGQWAATFSLGYSGTGASPIVTASNATNNFATPNSTVLVRSNGGSLDSIARRGDQPIGGTSGQVYGGMDGQQIRNNGDVRFRGTTVSPNVGSAPSPVGQSYITASAPGIGTVLLTTGATPAGQLATPAQVTTALTGTGSFFTDASGANTVYRATLAGNAATNSVIVFNDTVVAQLGVPLPGVSEITANVLTLDGLLSLSSNNGNYSIRGSVSDGLAGIANADTRTDFVLRNGAVVAKTGDALFTGSLESWDDSRTGKTSTFFANNVNSLGQMLVGGYTNGSINSDEVLLFDGAVVMREGDGVDLNGDGLLNDNAFIDRFFTDFTSLTDAGVLYTSLALRSTPIEGSSSVGTAWVVRNVAPVVVVPEAGTLSLYATGILTVAGLVWRRRGRQ